MAVSELQLAGGPTQATKEQGGDARRRMTGAGQRQRVEAVSFSWLLERGRGGEATEERAPKAAMRLPRMAALNLDTTNPTKRQRER